MKLITKEKLIKTIINDCKEFKKIVDCLFNYEFDLIVKSRVGKVYNLNYTMTTETQLFLIDEINNFVYHGIKEKTLINKLRKLIK